MTVWGIDIGHTALKAVKLNKTTEGLEIDQVAYIPMEGGDNEEERPDQVRAAVKMFLSRHPIRKERVVVSLPGVHAFSRFIKLPPVDPKKINEMVVFEAQQQIPFPIEEVMWGFHIIEETVNTGEETEVGIFAARRELLLAFLSELKENGVSPDVVTVAPLAILNFVKYNTELKEETVILDIGAKHTDLIVVKGDRFWIRNLRIAGTDVTQALAERFKIPTAEAEKLKRKGSTSKNADKIFKSMESVLKDFSGEIHRSISFFKSQAKEVKLNPKRMLILGDGAKLKNIRGFFEKELGFKVQKFTKLEQDKFVVGENVDFDVLKNHILSFGVSLGLGVQGLDEGQTKLNLLPSEDQIANELGRKLPIAIATAVVCWLAVFMSYFYWTGLISELNETIKSSGKTSNLLKDDNSARAAMKIDTVKKDAQEYLSLLDGRVIPLELLNRLRQILPQGNASIVELSQDVRDNKSAAIQQDMIKDERVQKKINEKKFWILELKIENTSYAPDPKDPKTANLPVRKGYKIDLLVARRFPQNVENTQVYQQLRTQVYEKILKVFGDEPFYVRRPGEEREDPGRPDAVLGSEQVIYALSKTVKSPDEGSSEEFRCLAAPISFEVGVKPLPKAPAPKKQGQ